MRISLKTVMVAVFAIFLIAGVAYAGHSWGNYHWARTTNPFALKLGDNVTSAWDTYLGTTSADWSISNALDTTIVTGSTNPKNCRGTAGRVEVCNSKYGNNGWLGLAQIWVSGSHITQAITKMNDTYFNTAKYNTPGWRNLVMCQEVGHTFGLNHQDENFSNANLGTCMDYTDDPDGKLKNQFSNEHPNQHDYDQLATIYTHLDSGTTVGQFISPSGFGKDNIGLDNSAEWGKGLQKDSRGKTSLYEKELSKNEKLFTFVFWAE